MPGVGETITWARALLALGPEDDLDATLGVALKVREDLERVREKGVLAGCLNRHGASPAWQRSSPASCRSSPLRCAGSACASAWASCSPRTGRSPPSTPARASRRSTRCARRCARRTPTTSAFAIAFAAVFGARDAPADDPLAELGAIARAVLPRVGVPADGDRAETLASSTPCPPAWSDEELLRDEGLRRLHGRRARRRAAAARAPRRARRRRASAAARAPARRRGHVPDLRATTRASLRHGGELLERRWRAPTRRPRRLVLRARRVGLDGALRAHAAAVRAGERRRARARRGVRVRHAADADHARARRPRPRPARCARAADARRRTGRAARASARRWPTLNREHGRRIGRGAFVVILSDGWDRGDPDELARRAGAAAPHRAPARLAQPARRPTRATSRSRAGMRAALPHVDRLLPGNSIESLEELADLMEGEPA